MSPNNNWYESIEKEISSLKEKIGKKDYRKYELGYLQRVAQKDRRDIALATIYMLFS